MRKFTSWFLALATGVLLCVPALAQLSVSGKIVDAEDGKPLPGATVRAGSFRGTVTNEKGEFSLKDLPKDIYKIGLIQIL